MAPKDKFLYTKLKRPEDDGHTELFTDLTLTLKPVDLETTPNIAEFYRGRNVFVTGGSGLMGKVLVEKLLRSCPEIGKVYLLLRAKKGVKPEERLRKITEIPLFDRVKSEQPNAVGKLAIISGDVMELRLGISEQDEYLLKDEVSVVFHTAASVRFDDPIKKAVLLNTRGTREMINLAAKMPHLKVLVHVSTTYCNAEQSCIQEKVYAPRADWRQMIHIAETADDDYLNILQPKILGLLPNTYTFTKALGEDIVHEQAGHLPVVIYRPSIVIPTHSEPIAGWCDNLNGPMGLIFGSSLGIIHSIYGNRHAIADWMPVDTAINGMIASSWYKGISDFPTNNSLVVNAASSNRRPLPYGVLTGLGQTISYEIPFNRILSYPYTLILKNYLIYYLLVIFWHVVPGIFIDLLLIVQGRKLRLMRIYRKIFAANDSLHYFIIHEWTFETDNFNSLQNVMHEVDRDKFTVNFLGVDQRVLILDTIYGLKRYFLKEDPDFEKTLPVARANLRRFYWLHCTMLFLVGSTISYILWKILTRIFI